MLRLMPGAADRSRPAISVAAVTAVAGIGGTVAAAFLPWTVSGAAARNSFATVRTARLLDLGDHAALSVLLGAWFAVPALAAATVLALVLGRRRLAAAGAVLVGALALVLAVAVLVAPIAHGAGPVVAVATGLLALAGGIALARPVRR
jgi:hypothetical protein